MVTKYEPTADLFSFLAVAEDQSFTAAAKRLGISHSVLSRRITRLEANLGMRLLQRNTRRLALTEAGQILYKRITAAKAEIEEAVLAVSQTQTKPCGVLRVHSPPSFGQLHLASALSDFIQHYPEIRIELTLGSQHTDLIEGGFDLGIRFKELPDSNLIIRRLALRSHRVCGTKKYFTKHGMPKTPHDLINHNCLIYEEYPLNKYEWRFWSKKNGEFNVKINGNFKANSSLALIEAAARGLGLVKLPADMLASKLHTGELVSVLDKYCLDNIVIYLVYPSARYLAPKVRVLIDFLVERFKSENYWNKN